ncbi:hypothetical protein AGOR_G00132130 [Albula goreensis]|uniref:Uncharacterized protein n=1 Tax=Albula goreensis TaxID=1534307 RepID=A0A8T3D6L2_9TELE|nr:hypothetical protein AGOR_G00132130 [Albula goreensis]
MEVLSLVGRELSKTLTRTTPWHPTHSTQRTLFLWCLGLMTWRTHRAVQPPAYPSGSEPGGGHMFQIGADKSPRTPPLAPH